MTWWVIAVVVVVMALLRWRRVGMLTWAAAWWLGTFAVLRFGFATPIPSSVLKLYLAIATAAILAYVFADAERLESVRRPLGAFLTERRYQVPLAAVVVLLPAAVAGAIWVEMTSPPPAPGFGRTVHPAPPEEVSVHDKPFNLIVAENPYRELETSDPDAFAEHVAAGRVVYYQNCFYCHGDLMRGEGMFAHALVPIPTNFTDAGTIAQLQESFLFWRIAKGGPGLPAESGPWETAMPAWERFLTEEEMWDVVLFLYEFTGQRPRARAEGVH